MLKNRKFSIWLALMLAVILMGAFHPIGALAQCGGGGHSSMQQQHMGSSRHMEMYATQAPAQPDPNAVAPGYVAPAPPASGNSDPQNTSGYGQMMGQGGAASGHSGHAGH